VRERALDHPRIQVAGAAGGDLLHRKAKTGESSRIVIRLDITRQQSYALTRLEARERAFKQGGLPRARRADEVQAKYFVLLKPLSQPAGDAIVLAKNLLFERQAAHDSSTSRKANSSSSPPMQRVSAEPQPFFFNATATTE